MTDARRWLLASTAVLTVAIAAPAFAQPSTEQAAQARNESNSTLIEEVVVTAERRAESVQDVPVAITAFSDKSRVNLGISTIQDLAQFTPGLSYNAANDRPTIRGVGRQNNNHGLNSPVANYIDGVYTSSVQDTSRRPIFIDRTEILRGPQGALSGKGSAAGAINTFTKRPRDYFEVEFGGYVNNYERWGLEGTITGPITDHMKYRFNAARYVQDEGFFTNLQDGSTEGDRFGNRTLFDLMLAGDIGKFDYFLKASGLSYDESLRDGGNFAPVIAGNNICVPTPFPSGALVPNNNYGYFQPGAPTACGNTGAYNNQAVIYGAGLRQNPVFVDNNDLRSFISNYKSDLHLDGYYNLTGDFTWHVPNVDIRYIVGRARYTYEQSSDADGSSVQTYVLPALAAGLPTRLINANGVNTYREAPSWFSNELTFTSTWDKHWDWIFGLYQFNQYTRQSPQTLNYPGFDEFRTPYNQLYYGTVAAPFSGDPRANGGEGLRVAEIPNARGTAAQIGQQNTNQNSWASFGQITYKFNDQWKLTVGGRYNHDRETALERARILSNGFASGANGVNRNFQLSPVALDVSATSIPGFALVNPATAVLEEGYRLVDVTSLVTVVPNSVTAACPTGYVSVIGVTTCSSVAGFNMKALLGPGADLPYINPETGERTRRDHGTWEAWTGSLGVDYTPNDDTLVYFRYARGYRPGGFGSATAGFLPLNPYTDQESLDSYEVGGKVTLFSKLQVNASLFRYNYKDIQAALTRFERCTVPGDITSCSPTGVTVNLPTAINQGLELEGQWYATNNLQLVLSYGYLDAHIDDGKLGLGFEDTNDPAALLPTAQRLNHITCTTPSATCQSQNGNPVSAANPGFALDTITLQPRWTQDLSGNNLPQAPEHKVAANANYTFHLPMGNLTASVSYIWRSEAYSDLFNEKAAVVPAYSQTNARLVFREKDDKYQMILFAQNLFDQDVFESGGVTRRGNGITQSQITANGGTANGIAQSQIYYQNYGLVLPRVFGVEFLAKFR